MAKELFTSPICYDYGQTDFDFIPQGFYHCVHYQYVSTTLKPFVLTNM